MGDVKVGRGGFAGQSLIVELWGERQLFHESRVAESERAGGPELNAILNRALAGHGFRYLSDIDEYGTTVFNGLQLRHVIPELERLRPFAQTPSEQTVLARVIELAERCRNEQPHVLGLPRRLARAFRLHPRTLAHHGVLFLDELTEFRRDAIQALRQPLEDAVVTRMAGQAESAAVHTRGSAGP